MLAHLKSIVHSKMRRRRLATCSKATLIITTIVVVVVALALLVALGGADSTTTTTSRRSPREALVIDTNRGGEETSDDDSLRPSSCHFHTCFDVLRCGLAESGRIGVHISPPSGRIVDATTGRLALDSTPSRQFAELLLAVESSPYYESNPDAACLVLPAVDTLNERRVDRRRVESVLRALPAWNRGVNHLLFNMIGESAGVGLSLVAGAGFTRTTYRIGYDVAIPVFHPVRVENPDEIVKRAWSTERPLLITALSPVDEHRIKDMKAADPGLVEIVRKCNPNENKRIFCVDGHGPIPYPEYLSKSSYCLVLSMSHLLDAMMMGCIPVILEDDFYVLPFSEVLDWKKASVTVLEEDVSQLVSILERVPPTVMKSMSIQTYFLWKTYMSSMEKIALTTLKIINDRVFTHAAWQHEDWNSSPDMERHPDANRVTRPPPLFIPLKPPQVDGFTAVILTYNRLEMLFKVIACVSQARSLSKVVIVWNNQDVSPPKSDLWPSISKPLVVVQTTANHLGNRFYPHAAIETEAVLNIDDDLFMLSGDELEFGYQVWREFPERLVGYPGRMHTWDKKSKTWKYEPEWVNEVSMVLSGAAFHHKFYSHAYTYMMPRAIRDWVDDHMNCEDIAINFLVSSYSRQPPIKVTPRKKFKCMNCTAKESLWSDPGHFHERNICFNHFVNVFGRMPLKAVEFRADPVLFKDNLPDYLKRYPSVRDV